MYEICLFSIIMNELEYIEIKVNDVPPHEFDISNLMDLLKNVENLLYPNDKRNRPTISYEVKEGSTRNIVRTIAGPIIAVNAILSQIGNEKSIDSIDPIQGKAIQNIQEWAVKNNQNLIIKTSLENTSNLEVNRTTQYYRSENIWIDSDLYLYGKIVDMGGMKSPNIHLATDDYGLVTVQTTEEVLANQKDNRLYKYAGIHVQAKQNVKSGKLDKNEVKLLAFVDYEQGYDDDYLSSLINKASKSWKDVTDTDKWLAEIRGIL